MYNARLLGLLLCFLVWGYPAAMLSLSGSTPLLCFSCPGLPRPWSVFLVRVHPVARLPCPGLRCCDVFLVRVYPVALCFLVRVYPAVALFPLSGFTPLRCFPCPGLPRCSVFLVRVYPGFDACGFIVARGKYIIYNLNIYLLERPSEQSRATQGQVHQRLPPFAQLL